MPIMTGQGLVDAPDSFRPELPRGVFHKIECTTRIKLEKFINIGSLFVAHELCTQLSAIYPYRREVGIHWP